MILVYGFSEFIFSKLLTVLINHVISRQTSDEQHFQSKKGKKKKVENFFFFCYIFLFKVTSTFCKKCSVGIKLTRVLRFLKKNSESF